MATKALTTRSIPSGGRTYLSAAAGGGAETSWPAPAEKPRCPSPRPALSVGQEGQPEQDRAPPAGSSAPAGGPTSHTYSQVSTGHPLNRPLTAVRSRKTTK